MGTIISRPFNGVYNRAMVPQARLYSITWEREKFCCSSDPINFCCRLLTVTLWKTDYILLKFPILYFICEKIYLHMYTQPNTPNP